jgi:hypothetical protein
MSEKTPKTSPLARVKAWITAHPLITGIVVGSSVMIACDVIASVYQNRAEAELGSNPTLELESEGEVE